MARHPDPLDVLGEDERAALPRREPDFVEPMLALLTHDHFSDPEWFYERKLDGERLVVVRDGRGTRLYSRNRHPLEGTYPEEAEALAASPREKSVADGEVVAFDGDESSFSRLQSRLWIPNPDRARATGVAVIFYL